jgi:hypothetical protein
VFSTVSSKMNKANIRKETKVAILGEYMKSVNPLTGKLMNGAMKNIIIAMYGPIVRSTVYRIVEEYNSHGGETDFTSKLPKRCGRKSKLTDDVRAVYVQILTEYSRLWIR